MCCHGTEMASEISRATGVDCSTYGRLSGVSLVNHQLLEPTSIATGTLFFEESQVHHVKVKVCKSLKMLVARVNTTCACQGAKTERVKMVR